MPRQHPQDVATEVLKQVDAVQVWEKLILQQEKRQVVASVMEYLTDRVYGRTAQTIQGNAGQPVVIQLAWGRTVSGSATVNNGQSTGQSHHHVIG